MLGMSHFSSLVLVDFSVSLQPATKELSGEIRQNSQTISSLLIVA
jgi:hypothetical protein